MGYSMVTPNEKASLQRLMKEFTRVSRKKHIYAAIYDAAWDTTTKEKAFYESLARKALVGDKYFEAE